MMKYLSRAAGLSVLLLASPLFAAEPGALFDRWYSLLMNGKPVGWVHEQVTQAEGRVTSTSQTNISLKRGPAVISIEIQSDFVETEAGQPIKARFIQKMGESETQRILKFGDGTVEMVLSENGRATRKTVPAPTRPWRAPADAGRYVEQKIKDGAKDMTVSVMDPAGSVTVVDVTMKHAGEASVEVLGKVVPSTVWNMTISNLPGIVTKVNADAEGRPLRTTLTLMPGMGFVVLESDEQLAKAQVDPPELMRATLLKPDKPIQSPRQTKTATYRVTFTPPEGVESYSPQIPRGGYQRVVWGDQLHATVVVDLTVPVNPEKDLPGEEHKAASAVLDTTDPEIVKLVEQALKDAPAEPVKRAEALRRFVHHYIHAKNLSVGFATASEVARTREGDCSEHGVLLAALLRGAGIPSRTVSGVIYVDEFLGAGGVFGYHMWAQAWVDVDGKGARWVDLDGTLDDATPFDAAHIALAYSAHTDEAMMNDMVAMAPTFGRMKIDVVSVEGAR